MAAENQEVKNEQKTVDLVKSLENAVSTMEKQSLIYQGKAQAYKEIAELLKENNLIVVENPNK